MTSLCEEPTTPGIERHAAGNIVEVLMLMANPNDKCKCVRRAEEVQRQLRRLCPKWKVLTYVAA